jgi:hypothetical protein
MALDRVAERWGRARQILAVPLPHDIDFASLVEFAKLRWRIERDHQALKQEVGLDQFEVGLTTLKAEAGEASTITPASASPPTAS